MSKAELPVFSDNLRSSGSWQALLARTLEEWRAASTADDSGARLELRLRERQLAALKAEVRRAGDELDEPRLREAVDLVSRWAAESRAAETQPRLELDTGRLLELHRVLIGGARGAETSGALMTEELTNLLRKTEPLPIAAMHDPTPAVLLPRLLDQACDWFTTRSFNELHPVEQAAVVFLRLLDLHPFSSQTAITATLAAGFYLERAGLPPLMIAADPETQARYRTALEAAFRMLTQPLVELIAEILARTMRECLGAER
jgi:hypothetical protein